LLDLELLDLELARFAEFGNLRRTSAHAAQSFFEKLQPLSSTQPGVSCSRTTHGILNHAMKKILLSIVALLLATLAAEPIEELAPLPVPMTNNAVAGIRVNGQELLYSLMGLTSQKTVNSISNSAYALNLKYNKWTVIKPVPGSGRLGAVAVGTREQIFLFGGYVPNSGGGQAIVSDVEIYDPTALRWYRGADMPVAVRDAVAGSYRDRYIYVIGGFTSTGPTNQVQLYDAEADKWMLATASPGAPVGGHAGAVVKDTIIYVDGAQKNSNPEDRRYVPSDECWLGKIDRHDPKKIQWSKLPPHPGAARYRIAAGGSERDQKVYFAGGSDTVYDFNGIGFDGKPAEPSSTVFAFDLRSNNWQTIQENAPSPSMDHRGLIIAGDGLVVIGGMSSGQKVIGNVRVLPKGK
jgi:N-acetylneuraminic acid mutarotase